ncbi:hypothetical protein U9M48_044685 [Paspalum notatum var. saurae]|uniref:Uncharacterized protein n=1 Tax=Paspalum notatum var. saurae TaxID=547442 RepID=A0AAQ3UXD5_PASNO
MSELMFSPNSCISVLLPTEIFSSVARLILKVEILVTVSRADCSRIHFYNGNRLSTLHNKLPDCCIQPMNTKHSGPGASSTFRSWVAGHEISQASRLLCDDLNHIIGNLECQALVELT